MFLGDSVYLKGSFEKTLKLEYYLIDKIEYFTTENKTRFGKIETVENVNVTMKDNEVYDLKSYLTNVNSLGFVKLIEGIMEEMQKTNRNSEKINVLFNLLEKSSQGAKLSSEKQKQSQTEEVITKLPLVLDKDRLIELTNKPTLHRIQGFVLSCYVEKYSDHDDKEESEKELGFRLKDGLTLEEVEGLLECFEEIEYNKVVQASFASATAKAKNLFRGKQ